MSKWCFEFVDSGGSGSDGLSRQLEPDDSCKRHQFSVETQQVLDVPREGYLKTKRNCQLELAAAEFENRVKRVGDVIC